MAGVFLAELWQSMIGINSAGCAPTEKIDSPTNKIGRVGRYSIPDYSGSGSTAPIDEPNAALLGGGLSVRELLSERKDQIMEKIREEGMEPLGRNTVILMAGIAMGTITLASKDADRREKNDDKGEEEEKGKDKDVTP
ncbi:hypothetical protein QBC44DRAFT_367663 [Cladorrhinum sp. PSN332]|nr:hypothetical protein QBC44DRAFT_367663 [Cladorrhinum sp. PSN332]